MNQQDYHRNSVAQPDGQVKLILVSRQVFKRWGRTEHYPFASRPFAYWLDFLK
jgi:hypothetical protein